MSSAPENPILATAAVVYDELEKGGVRSALIGAIALAVHGYTRATSDLDLASFVSPYPALSRVESALKARGLTLEFRYPEPGDPLGCVLRVEVDEDRDVDVVNFLNPGSGGPLVVEEAIAKAEDTVIDGKTFRVVPLPHLVAIKLYSGGPKARFDVGELLIRRPETISDVRDVCSRFGYSEALEKVLTERGLP